MKQLSCGIDLNVGSVASILREKDNKNPLDGFSLNYTNSPITKSERGQILRNRKRLKRKKAKKRYLLRLCNEYFNSDIYSEDFLELQLESCENRNINRKEASHIVYYLRKIATKEKLTLEELTLIFYNMLSSRGYLNPFEDYSEKDSEEGKIKEALSNKEKEYSSYIDSKQGSTYGEFIFDNILKEVFNTDYKFHIRKAMKNKMGNYSNFFYRKWIEEEFNKIWDFQKQFHSELTDSIKQTIENIIFSQKPSILEKNPLKCKVIGSQVSPTCLPSYELFSLYCTLNDIIIITYEEGEEIRRTLTKLEKLLVIDYFLSGREKFTWPQFRKEILKSLKCDINLKTSLDCFKNPFNTINQLKVLFVNFSDSFFNSSKLFNKSFMNKLDDVISQMYFYKAYYEKDLNILNHGENRTRYERIEKTLKHLDSKINLNDFNMHSLRLKSGYGRQSLKLIYSVLPEMYSYGDSLNTVISKIFPEHFKQHSKKTIDKNNYKEMFYFNNDLTSNSQIVKLGNRISVMLKTYYERHGDNFLNAVINIESGKDLQLSEKKKEEKFKQDIIRKKYRNNIFIKAKQESGKDEYFVDKRLNDFIMLYECDKECPFCDRALTIDSMEIGHIYPASITGDHGQDNLIAICRDCNAFMRNRIPYDVWGNSTKWKSIISKLNYLIKKHNFPKSKISRIKSPIIPDRFKNRYLNDNAHASKIIGEWLKSLGFKVNYVSGKLTHDIGLSIRYKKNRDILTHHLMDAYFLTFCDKDLIAFSNQESKSEDRNDYYWNYIRKIKKHIGLDFDYVTKLQETFKDKIFWEPEKRIKGSLHEETAGFYKEGVGRGYKVPIVENNRSKIENSNIMQFVDIIDWENGTAKMKNGTSARSLSIIESAKIDPSKYYNRLENNSYYYLKNNICLIIDHNTKSIRKVIPAIEYRENELDDLDVIYKNDMYKLTIDGNSDTYRIVSISPNSIHVRNIWDSTKKCTKDKIENGEIIERKNTIIIKSYDRWISYNPQKIQNPLVGSKI